MTDPGHAIDFQTILEISAAAPGSPRVDDFGLPIATATRMAAVLLDQDVYYGATMKAAAALDLLLRHPWLEHHQARAAWTVTEVVLAVNGLEIRSDVATSHIASLLQAVVRFGFPITDLSATLRGWTQQIAHD